LIVCVDIGITHLAMPHSQKTTTKDISPQRKRRKKD
jgi:hypothetical protein